MELSQISWSQVISLLPLLLGGGVIALALFWKPVTGLLKLLVRSGLWAALLALTAPLTSPLGVSLGVNGFSALVLGILGLPGMGLLLLTSWLVG